RKRSRALAPAVALASGRATLPAIRQGFLTRHFLRRGLLRRLRPLPLLIPTIMKRLVRRLFFHNPQLTPAQILMSGPSPSAVRSSTTRPSSQNSCHSGQLHREESAFPLTTTRSPKANQHAPRPLHPTRQAPRRVGRTPFPAPRRRTRPHPHPPLRRQLPLRLRRRPPRPLPPRPGQMHPPASREKFLPLLPRPQRLPLHPYPNRPLRRLRHPRRRLVHPPPRRHSLPTRHPPHPPPPKFQILQIQRGLAFADDRTMNFLVWGRAPKRSPKRNDASREAAKECSPRRKPWVSRLTPTSPGRGERNAPNPKYNFRRTPRDSSSKTIQIPPEMTASCDVLAVQQYISQPRLRSIR